MDPFNTAGDDKSENQEQDKNESDDRMDEDEPQRPNNLKGDPNKTTTDAEAGKYTRCSHQSK